MSHIATCKLNKLLRYAEWFGTKDVEREREIKKKKRRKDVISDTPESTDQSRSTTVVGIEQMIQILFKV